MAEQSVTLQPSESKVVSFEAVPHEARTYQVSVNGLTGSFRAIAKPLTELQKILNQIEAGTWTATSAQLDAIADWPIEDYAAAIDAAWAAAAAEAEREGTVVFYGDEEGYYAAPPEGIAWEDLPPWGAWEDVPVPWEAWEDEGIAWEDY